VRGNAKHLVEAAKAAGAEAIFLSDATAAGEWLKQNLLRGDAALVKGSRGVHLEKALEIVHPDAKLTESH
jgi:UDP-N-acetylmuramoyl-tripeptide--D-alanyl-D-alanine ligase